MQETGKPRTSSFASVYSRYYSANAEILTQKPSHNNSLSLAVMVRIITLLKHDLRNSWEMKDDRFTMPICIIFGRPAVQGVMECGQKKL